MAFQSKSEELGGGSLEIDRVFLTDQAEHDDGPAGLCMNGLYRFQEKSEVSIYFIVPCVPGPHRADSMCTWATIKVGGAESVAKGQIHCGSRGCGYQVWLLGLKYGLMLRRGEGKLQESSASGFLEK
jgi:hypothetical protein